MAKTSAFGVSGRQGHDSSDFYKHRMLQQQPEKKARSTFVLLEPGEWADQIYCQSATPFPVELAEKVIRLYSHVGDVVMDPLWLRHDLPGGQEIGSSLRWVRHRS